VGVSIFSWHNAYAEVGLVTSEILVAKQRAIVIVFP